MHEFMQRHQRCIITRKRSNDCCKWLCREIHKIPYKQCSYKNPRNIIKSGFLGFSFAPKLLFGNVILNDFAYFINL